MLEAVEVRMIKARVASGASYRQVANELGVNPSTVKYWTDAAYREKCKARSLKRYNENPPAAETVRRRSAARQKAFYARHPQGSVERVRRQLDGLNRVMRQRQRAEITQTAEQVADRYTGRCDICGQDGVDCKQSRLNIDHNHNTGEFRGWLCGKCNSAIGYFCDNPVLLRKAAAYLETTNAKTT